MSENVSSDTFPRAHQVTVYALAYVHIRKVGKDRRLPHKHAVYAPLYQLPCLPSDT